VSNSAVFILVFLLSAMASMGATKPEEKLPAQPQAGQSFRECKDCPIMMVIPPGSFMREKPSDDPAKKLPKEKVNVPYSFAVSITHVTKAQFRHFVEATGYNVPGPCHFGDSQSGIESDKINWDHVGFAQTERDPVLCVSMNDVAAYLRWLNKGSDGPYRLLNGTEYEYAGQAGATTKFPWGDHASHEFANYGLEGCTPCGPAIQGRDRWLFTSPGGSFPPNRFGLYDMVGNAWCYLQNGASAGGGWLDPKMYLGTGGGGDGPPVKGHVDLTARAQQGGFRIARDLGQ
jgi:formylglycine-generating enzyme required for sulfatase activity